MKSENYGETARSNGLTFESLLTDHYKNPEEKLKLILKIKNHPKLQNIPTETLLTEGKLTVLPPKKVPSILPTKKTTAKADLWFTYQDIKITFSIKMSDKGTQLQVIPINNFIKYCEHQGANIPTTLVPALNKFCGITKPTKEELTILNENRTEDNKNKERFWMNELTEDEQTCIVNFLKTNKKILFDLIYKHGMCLNEEHQAEYFILNKSYFTGTKKIDPEILSFDEICEKFSNGEPRITNSFSLEISNHVGLQRKGSGKGASKTALQFKDRGYKNML